MGDVVFQLTKTDGVKSDYYFAPDYTRWIVKAPDNKGSLIFSLSTDSDDGVTPKSYQVLESPREIVRLLNEHGVKTIEVNNVYFTRSGSSLAVTDSYTTDHTIGVLNTKQQSMLHQFLAECEAAERNIKEETVTLRLGGDREAVGQFVVTAQQVADHYDATINITSESIFSDWYDAATIAVHLRPRKGETSRSAQEQYVNAVRQNLSSIGSAIGVGYGSDK